MVLTNQQLVYWGGGNPYAFGGAVFQYAGFLICQLIFSLPWMFTKTKRACFDEFEWFPNGGLTFATFKLVLPCALFDLGDKFSSPASSTGSGLYIVVLLRSLYGPLIRRFRFNRKLPRSKWVAVFIITAVMPRMQSGA